ncbi:MAG: hypothetical protein MJH11_21570, partial [Lentisphaeria bacterium]|nr:hypothetical protein [Lentisphaeria bacterium]
RYHSGEWMEFPWSVMTASGMGGSSTGQRIKAGKEYEADQTRQFNEVKWKEDPYGAGYMK